MCELGKESITCNDGKELTVYLFQIREGRLQGVGQCLIREYRMVCHVMKGEISKDFVEVLSAFSIVSCSNFSCCYYNCESYLCRGAGPYW